MVSLKTKPRYRNKTLAAWLALLLGAVGAHRLYLRGWRDGLAWLWPLPTMAGAFGFWRLRVMGLDDGLGALLVPLLGLSLSAAMLTAIIYALTPDAKWDARHNPGQAATSTGWGAVLAAIAALMLGGAVLMGTIAFAGQRFFEWQLQAATAPAQSGDPAVAGQKISRLNP